MSGSVVEVGLMGVKTGKKPMNPKTSDGKILIDAWEAVIKAPRGPQRVYWGLEVEDSSKIWAWFDWKSLEEHENFAKSFGREATEKFGEVFTPGFTKHVFLNTEVLRSPVTEVMLAFFPSKVTTDAQTTVSQRFSEFNHKALKQCKDVRSVSSGWGLEADFPIRGDGNNGGKGMLFIALIGWGSVNEHNAFRESDVFKEYVGLITGMEECLDLSMFHLRCEVLERQGDN